MKVKNTLIAEKEEGFKSKPYFCPANKCTIGIGTTIYFDTGKAVTMADKPIDIVEARRLLNGWFNVKVAPLVSKLCPNVTNQNQFDAIADFIYNAGTTYKGKDGKIHYYALFENINNKMPEAQLRKYWQQLAITGGGKVLDGLIRRRKEEVDLFFTK